MIQHLHVQTPLGNAMEALIRTYQLWAGIHGHVLSDTQPCPWIPNQWLTALRMSLKHISAKICYPSWTVLPLRQGDQFLMEDFNNQDFPRHKLEKLNACQMYLQVTMLSEITDHTGTELLLEIISKRNHKTPVGLTNTSHSTLKWPLVSRPAALCWQVWTSTICTLYTGSTKGTWLTQPLGPLIPTYDTTRFWHWRMFDDNPLVYQHSPTAPYMWHY